MKNSIAIKSALQNKSLNTDLGIYIAGHTGMVGSAIVRQLKKLGFTNLITRSHNELDLTDQRETRNFFQSEKIEHVVLAAARVGGIHANRTYPAEFIYQNLMMQTNVIHQAYDAGISKLFLEVHVYTQNLHRNP